jgi:predicted RNA binding protein YcfA (HicA-like mRNA interferase family)
MKKFKDLDINEQHREKGRFRPTVPHKVSSVATASPRKDSDSADVRLREDTLDSTTLSTPEGNQMRGGYTPASRSFDEKPFKEPMKKYKEVKEDSDIEIPKDAPSIESIAKKHGLSVAEIEKQLKVGMSVEAEHGKNERSEREIALDHLNEKPDYYKKLKKYVEETEMQLDEMPGANMNTRDVHQHLKKRGWSLSRTSGGHDVYTHTKSIKHIAVPRHKQLKAPLIMGILKTAQMVSEESLDELDTNTLKSYSSKAATSNLVNLMQPGEQAKKKTLKRFTGMQRAAQKIIAKEEKDQDKGEYDYEGDMAMSDLRSIIHNAQQLHDMMEKDTNLPEWLQAKITKAEDYISSATNYMRSEVNEEMVQEGENEQVKDGDPCWKDYEMVGMKKKGGKQVPNCVPVKEESTPYWKKTSFIKKMSRVAKQERLEREKKEAEKKQVKEETLEEGRPSQSHPLEGHEYHKKTNAELVYIAKDAHKAAEAMKSHNTTAENKYRDQANDSATVRYFRQKNGMPDWYKKKYGHVNEEVDLDEKYQVVAKTKDGETFKSGVYHTKDKAQDMHWKLAKGNKHNSVETVKVDEEVESIEEAEDIHSHKVGDEIVLKNKDYHGVIVKSKGSDISFKNKSDNKHYKATHSMIHRNLSQENRYKEKSAGQNKKFDDAMSSDMKRIHNSGALKKFGIGVTEASDPPFDMPYKKAEPTTKTDKSGAIHTPMSRVKNIAKMAMAKQSQSLKPVKEEKDESKKMGIIRDTLKSAKKKKSDNSNSEKFESDPIMSSEIQKQ